MNIRPVYNFFLRSKHFLLATVNSFFQIIKSFFVSRWAQAGLLSLFCVIICFIINVSIYRSQKLTADECLWISNIITVLLAVVAFVEIKDTNNQQLNSHRIRFSVFWRMFSKIAVVIFLTVMGGVFAMKKESISANELQREKKQNAASEEKNKRDIADTVSSRVRRKEDELVGKYNKRLDEKSEQIIGHFVEKLIENGKLYDKKQDKVIDAVGKNKPIDPPVVHCDSIPAKRIANNFFRFMFHFSNQGSRARDGEVKIYYLTLTFGQFYPRPPSYLTFNMLDKGHPAYWSVDLNNYNPYLIQTFYIYIRITYLDTLKEHRYSDDLIFVIDPKNHRDSKLESPSGNDYLMLLNRFKEKYSELK